MTQGRGETTTATRRSLIRGAAAGAGTALAVGPAAAAEDGDGGNVKPDFGGWLEGIEGGFQDARGQDSVTVRVGTQGNGGPFAFTPANLWIDPGTTVTFEWVSDTHTVTPESQPSGAGFEGEPDVMNTGHSFETTFDTGGLYEYYCEPHLTFGMKGGVAVGDDVPTAAVGTGGGGGWTMPEGSGLWLVMMSVVGLAVAGVVGGELAREIRNRGGVRGPAPEETGGPTAEAETVEPAERLDHDEYDPWGTASLIAGYLLILVVMWLFMYFVEFLGNGPTVVG